MDNQHIKNIKILEKARNILRDLGFNVFFYSIQESKKRIMVYSKKLFQQFDEMMKNPTQFFLSLDENEKKEFIAGFLDAEGTVTDRVVIYNSNKNLLESMKEFLAKFGIKG
jgi:hypothetical protein